MNTATQWLLISIGKSVVASMLMGFLATYATAFFAIRNGLRVPVEGVPYINFAIGLATLAVFMGSLTAFGAILLVARYINIVLFYLFDILRSNFRIAEATVSYVSSFTKLAFSAHGLGERLTRRAEVRVKDTLGSSTMLLFALLSFAAAVYSMFNPEVGRQHFHSNSVVISYFLFLSVTAIALFCRGKQYEWQTAQFFASTMIFAFMAASLFANDVYGSFLRLIRHGGGIEVAVRATDGTTGAPTDYLGNLMLVTSASAMLLTVDDGLFVEVPRANIIWIKSRPQPGWQLPHYNIRDQGNFILLDFIEQSAR